MRKLKDLTSSAFPVRLSFMRVAAVVVADVRLFEENGAALVEAADDAPS